MPARMRACRASSSRRAASAASLLPPPPKSASHMTPHHINMKVLATPAVTVKRRLTRRPEGFEPRLRIDLTIHRTRLQAVSTLIQQPRSEEHTSELQSLMRTSYAVFCLKTKQHNTKTTT